MIAAYDDLSARKSAYISDIRPGVLEVHCPGQISRKKYDIISIYSRPVTLERFEITVPYRTEYVHGLGIVYGQVEIAYCIYFHKDIIAERRSICKREKA